MFIPALSRNSLIPFHLMRAQVKWFNDAGLITMYLGFHLKWPTFLPVFIQIWIIATDFYESPQYQISLKSALWKVRRYMWAGGRRRTSEMLQALFATMRILL